MDNIIVCDYLALQRREQIQLTDFYNESCKYFEDKYESVKWTVCPKIATVISCLAVVLWLISKVKPDLFPFDPTYPAIAVFTLCEAVVYWNKKRIWACLLFAAIVISLGCFIPELMLQL